MNGDTYRARRARAGGPLRVPSLGSQRRIRALARLGWAQRTLERRWGFGHKTLSQVLLRPEITREKAQVIARGYRDLAWTGQPGPDARARAWAERRGWPGPTDWDDIDRDSDVTASCVIDRDHIAALRVNREVDKMLAKRKRRAEAAAQRSRRPADRQLAAS